MDYEMNAVLGQAMVLSREPYEYTIGIDTNDKNANAYCFCRNVFGTYEFLHAKIIMDEKEFKEEVENLAKYFNATIVGK